MSDPERLRKLAAWYREFAERAGNPAIWEMRLNTAKRLEAEAERYSAANGSSRTAAQTQPSAPAGVRAPTSERGSN